jgi:signal transduction histidine kinase/ligand-binding sensor domain-containing protein
MDSVLEASHQKTPIWRGFFALLALALVCMVNSEVSARDQTINELFHRSWSFAQGAPGQISAMHQTPDGFLWLAAAQSLYRFDGVRFEEFIPDDGKPVTSVTYMVDDEHGGLWLALHRGITHLVGRHAIRYLDVPGAPGGSVDEMVIDSDHRVWAASSSQGLFMFDGTRWSQVGKSWGYNSPSAVALLLDRSGKLWVATGSTLMWLPPHGTRFVEAGVKLDFWTFRLRQAPDGAIWAVSQSGGVRPVIDANGRPYQGNLGYALNSADFIFTDHGALWVTTLGDGLRRADKADGHASLESFTAQDGLSANYAWPILQDREGNIWVGTSAGLDRFRESALSLAAFPHGSHDFALAADAAGNIVAGTTNQPLMRLSKDGVHEIRAADGSQINIIRTAYCDERGDVWLGGDDALWKWREGVASLVAKLPVLPAQVQAIESDGQGGVWVAIAGVNKSIWHWHDGGWTRLTARDGGEIKLYVLSLLRLSEGRLLIGADDGSLYIADRDHVTDKIDSSSSGIGSILVLKDFDHVIWLGGRFGIAVLRDGKVTSIPSEGNAIWGISALIFTPSGDLWIDAVPAVFHISSEQVRRSLDHSDPLKVARSFDYLDGLPGRPSIIRPLPGAIRSDDGRLWFATENGVAWLNPSHIPFNNVSPPIMITGIRVDGGPIDLSNKITVPSHTSTLEIDYTALSLTVPDRVSFKYKLDGYDKDWQFVANRRSAYFSYLPPGNYRFRVMASNNDGVWNALSADLDVDVSPTFYQTWWFRLLCVAACVIVLWLMHLLRVRRASVMTHRTLEAKHIERERIARNLHDTLLQGLQGIVLQFQAALDQLNNEPKAKKSLEEALDAAERVVVEARVGVLDLRSNDDGDLVEKLHLVTSELSKGCSMQFSLLTEGVVRRLDPYVKREIILIAKEAIFNAFQHSRATLLEVELAYQCEGLRVRIRDNGDGMPEHILALGRPGHWGLEGMRERAKHLSSPLRIWSREGAGTEVELFVSGRAVYLDSVERSFIRRLISRFRS